MDFIGTVADRVVLTPAERAVIVEQAEAARLNLDTVIQHCKDGTAGDVIKSYVAVVQANEYVTSILNTKIVKVIQEDHENGRGH